MKGIFIFWALCVIGWIINIIKVINGLVALPHIADISGMIIIRLIGIPIAPVGVILGWLFW